MSELNEYWDYFDSADADIWDWQENGDAVVWSRGPTVALRQEIVELLPRLPSTGWPNRFGALVWLLAACRDSWKDASSGRRFLEEEAQHELAIRVHQSDYFARLLDKLDQLHALRTEVSGLPQKSALVAMVFQCAPARLEPHVAGGLLQAFRNRKLPHGGKTGASHYRPGMRGDLHCLAAGLQACDLESLPRSLATGLESPVHAAPVELPPGESARSLIERLKDDVQLGGVARLARQLLAVLSLPRPLCDPEDLSVGGVSDITNRGHLDRLLLSELAQDDLTLAVRVALREALYLRRDPLPRRRSRQRLVMIDTGIRMWGVPRVFATAVALAAAAQADQQLDVHIFRSSGSGLEPADLHTEQGLSNQLAALDHPAHPGAALAVFGAHIRNSESNSDALLITEEEVLEDHEFLTSLSAAGIDSLYVATVNRDGRFRLIQRGKRGQRQIKEAQWQLADVLSARQPKQISRILDSSTLSPRPAILGVTPFPLLLPFKATLANSWHVHGLGVVSYRGEGQLFLRRRPSQAYQPLHEDLPPGTIQWAASELADDWALLVVGKLSQKGLYAIRLHRDGKQITTTRLQLPFDVPQRVFGHRGWIYVVFGSGVGVFHPETGEMLDQRNGEFVRRLQRRFYTLDNHPLGGLEWHALSFDGQKIRDDVITGQAPHAPPLLTVFDSGESGEGPIGVLATGELLGLENQKRRSFWSDSAKKFASCRVLAVSRDGRRLVFCDHAEAPGKTVVANRSSPPQRRFWLARCSGNLVSATGPPQEAAEAEWLHWKPCPVPRRRFARILVDEQQRLTLVTAKGTHWPLVFDRERNQIVLPQQPALPHATSHSTSFQAVTTPATPRLFSVADWADGSRAVLDGRGLLHLASSQPNISECSILLMPDQTSGWVADGRCWGDPFFLGDRPATSPELIYEQILRPFIACLA